MLFLRRLLAGKNENPVSTMQRGEESKGDSGGPGATASRKQLLLLVLKETLLRAQVPRDMIGMEFLRVLDKREDRTRGIHVRMLVLEADARLLAAMPRLERDFRKRLRMIDYRAPEWLQGVSWQFVATGPVEADADPVSEGATAEVPPVRNLTQASGDTPPRMRTAPPPSTWGALGATYAYTAPSPLE